MKFTKLAALTLSSALLLGLCACGGGNTDPVDNGSTTYTVGICQLAPHVALDAATQGFQDALNEALPGQVEFKVGNAAGDSPTCATIVNGFVSEGVDLIMANATPALNAAATATGDIPVLGTSVTEYGVALGIENFSGLVGTNVSGTSDLAPLDKQADMILEWFPEAKNIGLLYCLAEANSKYQVDVVKAYLETKGLNVTLFGFSSTNDLAAVTQEAADASDVIYVPTDNTVANSTGIINEICLAAKVPIIAGEEGICSGCGVATLSISYYDLGVTTGEMAIKILKGEADISTMRIQYAAAPTAKYDAERCAELGLTPPEGYVAIEK